MVETKLRRIGNSLGIVLPSAVLKELRLSEGDEVSVAVYRRSARKGARIEDLVGLWAGAPPFEREKEDRFD